MSFYEGSRKITGFASLPCSPRLTLLNGQGNPLKNKLSILNSKLVINNSLLFNGRTDKVRYRVAKNILLFLFRQESLWLVASKMLFYLNNHRSVGSCRSRVFLRISFCMFNLGYLVEQG